MRKSERALNAGCMINNYEPVSLQELIANNKQFQLSHRFGFEKSIPGYWHIASFYGFDIYVEKSFSGIPYIHMKYEEDGVEANLDIRNLQVNSGCNVPQYLQGVLKDWLTDNQMLLLEMWEKKKILPVPDWEE